MVFWTPVYGTFEKWGLAGGMGLWAGVGLETYNPALLLAHLCFLVSEEVSVVTDCSCSCYHDRPCPQMVSQEMSFLHWVASCTVTVVRVGTNITGLMRKENFKLPGRCCCCLWWGPYCFILGFIVAGFFLRFKQTRVSLFSIPIIQIQMRSWSRFFSLILSKVPGLHYSWRIISHCDQYEYIHP